MITRKLNNDYSGGYPLNVGDAYRSQDLGRDFNFLLDRMGLQMQDLTGLTKFIASGGVITQTPGQDQLNVTIGSGMVKYSVTVPDSYASNPPSTTSEDIEAIRINWPAIANLNITGTATLNGIATNYVKLGFVYANNSQRARLKKGGNYYYDQKPSYVLKVDMIAPTAYQLCLGEFIGAGGGAAWTITHASKDFVLKEPIQLNIGSGNWVAPQSGIIDVVIVGGGGGGGSGDHHSNGGGGGGAGGGIIKLKLSVIAGKSYPYTVGDGGVGGSNTNNSSVGAASIFAGLTTGTANYGVAGSGATGGVGGNGIGAGGGGGGGGIEGATGGTATALAYGLLRDIIFGIGGDKGANGGNGYLGGTGGTLDTNAGGGGGGYNSVGGNGGSGSGTDIGNGGGGGGSFYKNSVITGAGGNGGSNNSSGGTETAGSVGSIGGGGGGGGGSGGGGTTGGVGGKGGAGVILITYLSIG